MRGYLALVLHAHLPFVRHPEYAKFLEENWLFEAITESYVPVLQRLAAWEQAGLKARLTLTLTPTLCAMLRDPLLQERYVRHLEGLIELAEKETHRTLWEGRLHELALFYLERFHRTRDFYFACQRDLVGAFGAFQDRGRLEVITSAATHAVLPLLARHPPSVRAQVLVACDHYRSCFGRDPRGIWLPECAYVPGLEAVLLEANLRWFITDSHGLLHARPRPRYALFAPIFTANGVAAFGRDFDSAQQVWSRQEGYPGDPRYRDFYRDIGFDLDFDYVKPHLPATGQRGFTGLKYYRITGPSPHKEAYEPEAAVRAADGHAAHFLEARLAQIRRLAQVMDRPPLVLAPYDAELFGHWWYEGPEFLDCFVRRACGGQQVFTLITPEDYLRRYPTNQVATPAASSWGEGGFWRVWLNEKNQWIYPHLHIAQERMTELARRFPKPKALQARALRQAARELLLAQASDWPFILRTGTSPDYARKRATDHLLRFSALYDQLAKDRLDEPWLAQIEGRDNLFPDLNYHYWA
ncbi:MAG: 1,4-alpha-glucan branching protein domain-containing protein [Verrucomicrobiota bacterium]|jgi:1,4-alpha-glucan branching enzyme